MRTKLALLAGVSLMAACSLVVDLDPLKGSSDAQSLDASDAGGSDASNIGDCSPGKGGPAMVSAGSFCIDQTEVTQAQYQDFVAANPPASDQPPECAWNGAWIPFSGQWTYQNASASYPITGVNWCQAYMFCKWAGKHLCGAPNGGPATSWASSAYYAACSHGGAHVYPYGDTYDAGACNGIEAGIDAAVPVPITTCAGGYPGLFDMVGNVQEWIDHCEQTDSGQNDSCFLTASSYGFGDPSCQAYVGLPRDALYSDLGFRCCSP